MTQRIRAIWRLATLFVRESRVKSAADAPIHRVLRSFSAGGHSRGATRLAQRAPVLQNLSGVLTMA